MDPAIALPSEKNRIRFVNQLRGLAAISVVISHFFGVFWTRHAGVMELMGVPELPQSLVQILLTSIPRSVSLVLGIFGVGVFFIISGLVISISIEKETRLTFFIRRVLRIYPVYIAGFSVTALALYLFQNYTDSPLKLSLFEIIAHYTIVFRDLMQVDRIDGISWTLEVELYFYLFMLLFGKMLISWGLKGLYVASVVIAAAAFFVNGFLGAQIYSGLILALGVGYHHVRTGRAEAKSFLLFQCWLLGISLILWSSGGLLRGERFGWLLAFVLAGVVFEICFRNSKKFKPSTVLDHFADISYPLYVCHALMGYSVIYYVLSETGSWWAATFTALLAAYCISLVIHIAIEKPSIFFAKRLTKAR